MAQPETRAMNARLFVSAALLWLVSGSVPAAAADTVTLHIVVHGLKTTTGTIHACVFKTPDGFPKCNKGVATVSARAPANAAQVAFDIPGVSPGRAAVAVFVDVNDNNRLDTGFMDIPAEPLGYSNNPHVTFGTPSFDDAAITVGADTTTTIKLKYF
jgi:uncharacterized protein (DUF2141 family)